ncbi:shikimate kinase [Luteimonas sp. e5]
MDTAANLLLVGSMGAGKTSIGKRLAELLAMRFVDADRELEARTGASVADIFAYEGEAGFRRRETALLADLLEHHKGLLIASGGGAVLAAENRRRMAERAFVVHLDVSVDQQLRRLARDRSRPLLLRDDREAALRALAVQRDPLYAAVADLRLDTDGLSPDQACAALLPLLPCKWRHQAA